MNIGAAGIFYIGPQSVSPVGSGDASNGVSIDPISGDVVLGNDVGGSAAALTSVREIPFSGQGIILSDTPNLINTLFFPGFIQVNTANTTVIIDSSAFQIFQNALGASDSGIVLNNSVTQIVQTLDATLDVYRIESNHIGQFGSYDVLNGKWQIGVNPGGVGVFNGALLEVVGNMTYSIFVDVTGGAIALSAVNDRGKLFTNQGGVSTFTLPTSNTSNRGLHYMFCVQQAVNLTVQAGAADTINIANLVSVVGGIARSNAVGSFLHLVAIGNNQWIAASAPGAWVVI